MKRHFRVTIEDDARRSGIRRIDRDDISNKLMNLGDLSKAAKVEVFEDIVHVPASADVGVTSE